MALAQEGQTHARCFRWRRQPHRKWLKPRRWYAATAPAAAAMAMRGRHPNHVQYRRATRESWPSQNACHCLTRVLGGQHHQGWCRRAPAMVVLHRQLGLHAGRRQTPPRWHLEDASRFRRHRLLQQKRRPCHRLLPREVQARSSSNLSSPQPPQLQEFPPPRLGSRYCFTGLALPMRASSKCCALRRAALSLQLPTNPL